MRLVARPGRHLGPGRTRRHSGGGRRRRRALPPPQVRPSTQRRRLWRLRQPRRQLPTTVLGSPRRMTPTAVRCTASQARRGAVSCTQSAHLRAVVRLMVHVQHCLARLCSSSARTSCIPSQRQWRARVGCPGARTHAATSDSTSPVPRTTTSNGPDGGCSICGSHASIGASPSSPLTSELGGSLSGAV